MRRLLAAALLLAGTAAGANLRALILSGRNNHDWRTTTPALRSILLASGRFDVRVNEEPAGIGGQTLAGYDVLVLDYNGPRWGEATEKAVASFVRSGKGLVAVHAASYPFGRMQILGDRHARTGIFEKPWEEYAEMIGGAWSEEAPRTGHGQRHSFRVKFFDREHAIARGLAEDFVANDELYHNIRLKPGARILATAYDDPKMGGTAKEEPILWTVNFGAGRVFQTTLGHDVAAIQEPGFMKTFARGAEWAATGAVTVPAEISLRKLKPDAVRVQVVTGGHDFDPTFDGLFEGHEDIAANVRPHPDAYKRDLRKSVDVLVLYDMVQQIEDAQKKNLSAFVESGKGLVVLHHAIASYQDWEWWHQEVIAGKYLLPKGSSFRHDVELFVNPKGKHPILSGVGRMHLWDETYKNMWISPRAQVLLETDHPTSDGPLAWVSPYAKSRVVYIQLGHDRQAHQHPAYRHLVRNAILWAGGRLK